MTKASKFLTILVATFSILYMGIAFMMWTVQVNWKDKATKDFPKSRIAEQNTRIQDLSNQIADTEKQHDAAKKGIEADTLALTAPEIGREAQLEAEWTQLAAEVSRVAGDIEAESKKVQAKQDEDKRLREDVQRLMTQYNDLMEQRTDAESNVKRQRDLLFQAKGVLNRLRMRARLLDSEEGTTTEPYDRSGDSTPAANRTLNTLKK